MGVDEGKTWKTAHDMSNSSSLDMTNGSAATNYASLLGHNKGFMGITAQDMSNSSSLDMTNGSAATNYASLMGHNTGFMGMSGGLVDMGLGVMRPRSATVGSMYPGRGLDEYSFRVGLMDRPLPKTYADQIEEMKQQNIL